MKKKLVLVGVIATLAVASSLSIYAAQGKEVSTSLPSDVVQMMDKNANTEIAMPVSVMPAAVITDLENAGYVDARSVNSVDSVSIVLPNEITQQMANGNTVQFEMVSNK